MQFAVSYWKKKDFASFFVIIALSFSNLLFTGFYPIIYPDSSRFLRAAIFLKPDANALTFVSFLLRPLVLLMGVWGFIFFQSVVLAYSVVMTLNFLKKNFTYAATAIILSGIGLTVVAVLSDVYTAAGLLALFLFLNGERDIPLYCILSISFVAHYGNVFLFPFSALVWWLIFDRKKTKHLLCLAGIFIILVFASMLANYALEDNFRFFPERKYSFLTARIMIDSPDIVRSYIKSNPDSLIAKKEDDYEDIISLRPRSGAILWHAGSFLDKLGNHKEINKESGEFLYWAAGNNPLTLVKTSLENVYSFFIETGYWYILKRDKIIFTKHINEFMPDISAESKNVLKKNSYYDLRFMEYFFKCSYYLSYFINIGFVISAFFISKFRRSKIFPFIIFVIIASLINAFLMSNFSGIFVRYLIRIMFLPLLSASLIAGYLVKESRLGSWFK